MAKNHRHYKVSDPGMDTPKMAQVKADRNQRKSRILRLGAMLAAIVVFCVIELVFGHLSGSLALVADAFHMMSDALALIIAAVAIRMGGKIDKEKNTFGWLRAEILGAVINGIFLMALCFTITMHAIERIISPEMISEPKLVLLVGGIGLLVNVFGMFLFHDHGHSHGHSHAHSHCGKHKQKKEKDKKPSRPDTIEEEKMEHLDNPSSLDYTPFPAKSSPSMNGSVSPQLVRHSTYNSMDVNFDSGIRSRGGSISEMSSIRRKINFVVHEELCRSASKDTVASPADESRGLDASVKKVVNLNPELPIAKTSIVEESESAQNTINSLAGRKLLESKLSNHATGVDKPYRSVTLQIDSDDTEHTKSSKTATSSIHGSNMKKKHRRFPSESSSEEDCCQHAHNHDNDMHEHANVFEHADSSNMHAVFLHILSDLLGSILVCITASCYILMDTYGQKYGGMEAKWLMYIDPLLSLLLVFIIAVPTFTLVREASHILLNNTPDQLSPVEFANQMMREIPEVYSVHDFYLWRLTANITIATVHVVMKKEPSRSPKYDPAFEARLMELSRKVNQFFHERGVHTTTIQMEFMDDDDSLPSSCVLRCSCTQAVTGVCRKLTVCDAKSASHA